MTRSRGRLIALEGIDGCGKSTQARILSERLHAVSTFEPGGTPLGASLRPLLLERDGSAVAPRAEALLLAADRAQHVADVILPALEAGRPVVTDRYSASTLAYQGFGRGLDREELEGLIGWATGGVRADLTILFDLPVAVAAARRGGGSEDRMEAEGRAFQQRVAEGFRALAAASPLDWVVIDASRPVDEVTGAVWEAVDAPSGTAGAS